MGNNSWEALANVNELAALDQYLALLGVGSVEELQPPPKQQPGRRERRVVQEQLIVPAPVQAQRRSGRDIVRPIRLIETIQE